MGPLFSRRATGRDGRSGRDGPVLRWSRSGATTEPERGHDGHAHYLSLPPVSWPSHLSSLTSHPSSPDVPLPPLLPSRSSLSFWITYCARRYCSSRSVEFTLERVWVNVRGVVIGLDRREVYLVQRNSGVIIMAQDGLSRFRMDYRGSGWIFSAPCLSGKFLILPLLLQILHYTTVYLQACIGQICILMHI